MIRHTKLALAGTLGLSLAAGSASAEVLLSDTFDSSDNTNISQSLATRQAGTLATASYNEFKTNLSIASNALKIESDSGAGSTANLKSSLTASTDPFSITFDLANTGSSWVATYLSSTNNSDQRGNSPFGFHLIHDSASNGFAYYSGSFGSQSGATVSKAAIDTALGVAPGTFKSNVSNTYQLLATPTTSTVGTYDILINGSVVVEDIAYNFGTSNIYWATRSNVNGVGSYDNLEIAIIPEPGSLALLGLGGLCLLYRRRK